MITLHFPLFHGKMLVTSAVPSTPSTSQTKTVFLCALKGQQLMRRTWFRDVGRRWNIKTLKCLTLSLHISTNVLKLKVDSLRWQVTMNLKILTISKVFIPSIQSNCTMSVCDFLVLVICLKSLSHLLQKLVITWLTMSRKSMYSISGMQAKSLKVTKMMTMIVMLKCDYLY